MKNKDMALIGAGGLALWYLLKKSGGSAGFVSGDGGGGGAAAAATTPTIGDYGLGGGGGTKIDTRYGYNPPVRNTENKLPVWPGWIQDWANAGLNTWNPEYNKRVTVANVPMVEKLTTYLLNVNQIDNNMRRMGLPGWLSILPPPSENWLNRIHANTTGNQIIGSAATLSPGATAFNSLAAQFGVTGNSFSHLAPRIQRSINAGTMPQRTQQSIATYAGVKNLTVSAFDAYGGAAAFPQGRAAIESVQGAFQRSQTAQRDMVERNRNRAPGTPALIRVWENGHYIEKSRGY